MSFNKNFYNNFHGTFQNTQYLPPPPPPPLYFIPPQANNDAEFIKQFNINEPTKPKLKSQTSISIVRDAVYNLIRTLKDIQNKETLLSGNLNNLSDEEWNANMAQIEEKKTTINNILLKINNLDMVVLQKLIAKRSAKRARLRRLRLERKREKEEWVTEMQEKSRKIDEKLQKTQDEIRKAKQDEEAKIQADIVLKETLRKKHDAKKYMVKLEALMKLRRARLNTAKGRGETGSEAEAETFNCNIEKLKTLWNQRLSIYEREEVQLRAKLEENCGERELTSEENERVVKNNLEGWKQALFGGRLPQVDFAGDVSKFISVRSEWDEFLSTEGTALPVGWVPPAEEPLGF